MESKHLFNSDWQVGTGKWETKKNQKALGLCFFIRNQTTVISLLIESKITYTKNVHVYAAKRKICLGKANVINTRRNGLELLNNVIQSKTNKRENECVKNV